MCWPSLQFLPVTILRPQSSILPTGTFWKIGYPGDALDRKLPPKSNGLNAACHWQSHRYMNSSPVVSDWSVFVPPRILGRWVRTCAPQDLGTLQVTIPAGQVVTPAGQIFSAYSCCFRVLVFLKLCRFHFLRRLPLPPSSLSTAVTGHQSSSRNNSRGRS